MAERKEKNYTFGEKDKEFVDGQYMPVIITPKYKASRDSAIALLNRKEFAGILTEGDFWILMNKTKTGKMAYTGLIISHDGLLKINDIIPEDRRFKEEYCSDPIPFEYAGKKGLLMIYRDKRDGMMEIGEIAGDNCKNSYPYAMLLKRTFDRVVKRKADLSGIYSDTEADEFAGSIVDMETGEILESKPSEKAEQPKPEPVKEAPKASEPKKFEVNATITLNDALAHVFENGNNWKGKTIKDLIEAESPESTKRQILNMFATRGSGADKRCCQVMLSEIEAGNAVFHNSTSTQ